MNVVYLTNKLVNGGGERVLVNLIATVRERGATSTVLFLGRSAAIDPDIQREVEAAGACVVRPRQLRATWNTLRRATTLHLFNLNVFVKVLPFLPFVGNRRLICHVHGTAGSANAISRGLFCKPWNPCDEIIFVSESGKRSYELTRGRVISNPVIFPPRRLSPPVLTGGSLKVLSVNRLVPVKRITAQIDIIGLLVDRFGLDVHLDVVGEGAELGSLRDRVASLNLGGRVRFMGGLPHAEVLALYHQYDLFLTTSAAEGLGLSLVEALAAGLPGIASSIAAYKEVAGIGGGVLFVDPDDPETAAATIHYTVRGKRFACADLDALAQRFEPAVFHRQIFAIYR